MALIYLFINFICEINSQESSVLLKKIIFLFLIFISQSASANNLSDSDTLFDWAEDSFPEFFGPSGQITSDQYAGYLIRYYN